jgi:serine O-acetyltransferase
LIDSTASQEHQIALLWQAIEKLSAGARELPGAPCVPQDAHTTEQFDAERLNRLVK